MNAESEFVVLPKEVTLPATSLTADERNSVQGLGFLSAMAVWLLITTLTSGLAYLGLSSLNQFMNTTTDVLTISAIVVAIPTTTTIVVGIDRLIKRKRIFALETKKAKDARLAYRTSVKRAEEEARSLTSTLLRILQSSEKLVVDLRQSIDSACKWLEHAEHEHNENAFDPFWVAVENGAQHLSAYNYNARVLSQNADQYYASLKDRDHTFPPFPVRGNTIPDASFAASEFRRLVRLGQTQIDFAVIEQHRRTREVLVAGFRTLGDAVNNLALNFDSSVNALRDSVSSDLAMSIEEGIKTRQSFDRRMVEQNRMLDNIQRHREPGLLDEPSKY